MLRRHNDRFAELNQRVERLERLSSGQEVSWLNGLRVQCVSDREVGTVTHVLLHRNGVCVQIGVSMDSGGQRFFQPRHLCIHASNF